MTKQPAQPAQIDQPDRNRKLAASLHDFNHQCLRILRCTAHAMASSPGGLRFKAGTRPWLEGLSANLPPAPQNARPRNLPMLRIAE